MSFWVHAFCNRSVADVTAADLRAGIEHRLKLLTYLFCPEDEEDPAEVLGRLRIDVPEDEEKTEGFNTFLLAYRPKGGLWIHVERSGRENADELQHDILPEIDDGRLAPIQTMLDDVVEDVAFCLKASDVDGMGFPLAIAAAAYLVERAGGGLIQSGTYSWMVPKGREVKIILEIER